MSKFLGVKINKVKEMMPGSDQRETKDGSLVPCLPSYITTYQYAGSYPYSTLEEAKESILAVFNHQREYNQKHLDEFAAIMNSKEKL